jgi:hypothetical protein
VRQAEADFKRQQELVQRKRFAGHAGYFHPTRDNAQANLLQAQVNTKIAAVNYGYTNGDRARLTASSARISLSRRRTRRRLVADAARHHRGARSDLGEFQRQ